MPLRLHAQGLSGELCTVDAERGWTVRQVKEAIGAAIRLPWWELRICYHKGELCDDQRLGAALRAAGADTTVESLDISALRVQVDRERWLTVAQERPMSLHEAPPPILADREVFLAAAMADIWALAYAAKELRSDNDFALAVVRQNGLGLKHFAAGPRTNKQVVLAAVQQNGQALREAQGFQADQEVVLAAMRQTVDALTYAAPELVGRRDFVKAAVLVDWRVLRYTTPELRSDPEILSGLRDPQATIFLSQEFRREDANDDTDEDELWISVLDAMELQEINQVLFLDARGEHEFEISHLWGACHTPGAGLEQMIILSRQQTRASMLIKQNKDKTVVVYSDSGSAVSRCGHVTMALRANKEIGATRILRLTGGLNEWKRVGFPVEGDPRQMYLGYIIC